MDAAEKYLISMISLGYSIIDKFIGRSGESRGDKKSEGKSTARGQHDNVSRDISGMRI